MIGEDLTDVPIEVFGGYCPAMVPSNLPSGAANIAQDVMFPQAGVRTRGGLGTGVAFGGTAIPAGASINGLKTYLTPSGGKRLMVWDSVGDMFKENPQGTLNLINSRPYQNLYYESQTLFGREYQTFFDANGGFDIPRQYDDTNWDRVSQVGPGVAPVAGDESISQAIFASATGLGLIGTLAVASGSQSGFLVTLVLTVTGNLGLVAAVCTNVIAGGSFVGTSRAFRPGDQWVIAGVGAGYNGTWAILSCRVTGVTQLTITYVSNVSGLAPVGAAGTSSHPYYQVINSGAVTVKPSVDGAIVIAGAGVAGYNTNCTARITNISASIFGVIIPGVFGLANSGNGTWSPVGNIDAGVHQVTVAYVTRQGFITQAAPPFSWTAAGSKRVIVGAIPTGPPNVQARLLLFTPVITAPATTGTFYSLPAGSNQFDNSSVMLIPDNVTTQVTVNFSDAILISGFNGEYLFSELELGECAFFIPYNSRTVWLGERSKLPNFENLTFDGGFTGTVPNGWTPDASSGAGGSSAIAGVLPADWGDAYAITGDGVTGTRGKITQSAYQDYLQVAILQPNTSYSVRVRVRSSGVLVAGTLHINLTSASGAFTTAGLSVAAAQATAKYQEFTAAITDVPLASPPADLLLQVYADGTPTNGGVFLVDSIEVFPTLSPANASIARLSRAFNPESFDSVTGQVQIRTGDGQQLRAGFPLRNSLYLAKDHYLGYVTDDGVNEPASWQFTEVSATIGICGPNAVDWSEEWAAFAERSGLYLCWGSDPVKITSEIQNDASDSGKITWESINWTAAHTIWVRIDKINRMILVGAPVNGATSPNVVFMMDYTWLDSPEDIASAGMVNYSNYTGKLLAHGRGRRWALWNIQANSMWFAERADGTAQPFFGGVGNAKVFWQRDVSIQGSDNGVAIASQYQSYPAPSSMEEQMYQLRAHRKLLGYLKFRAIGAGTLNLAVTTAQRSTILRGYTLSTNPVGDGERPVNLHGERFFLTASTNAVNSWFQLEKWIPCLKKDSAALVRGVSA
jgi:hypothetical protein